MVEQTVSLTVDQLESNSAGWMVIPKVEMMAVAMDSSTGKRWVAHWADERESQTVEKWDSSWVANSEQH